MLVDAFQRPISPDVDTPYLEQQLLFEDDKILDSGGWAVMMEWEKPLMAMHAAYICWDGVDSEAPCVANIGHGLGLVDTAIQTHNPAFHLVIEAHPQVYGRAQNWARSYPKSNIKIAHGKWQQVLLGEVEKLGRKLDGLFFDTWEETVEDLFPLLPSILRPNGRFSFCNMYQPHDVLRHAAYSLYLATRLTALGFTCEFRTVENPVKDCEEHSEQRSRVWQDVRFAYWTQDAYLLPLCTFIAGDGATQYDAPPVRERQGGDGRPAQMLLWKAKEWYLRSLCEDRFDRDIRQHDEETSSGSSSSASAAATVQSAISLADLWRLHCTAEQAAST